ncbi:hypothetical protein GUY59_41140 [Nonomuraea sp. K271]|nr:hypothetical protein [Nonomuraea sp. K271]
MSDLSAAAVTWRRPRDGRIGDCDYRIAFSADGPAFIELIQAAPGGPWDDTGASPDPPLRARQGEPRRRSPSMPSHDAVAHARPGSGGSGSARTKPSESTCSSPRTE